MGKIAILGGTGYLGGKIVKYLSVHGYEVICVHRQSSKLESLRACPQVGFCLNTPEAIEKMFATNDIDYVINAACAYDMMEFSAILEANFHLPLSLLMGAKKYNVPTFININTALPADVSAYSFTKRKFGEFGEFLTQDIPMRFLDLELVSFYGEDEPKNRFISRMAILMRKNEDVSLTTGLQCRDFIHSDDVVAFIECLVEKSNAMPFAYRAISVGTGASPSVQEIVRFIHQELRSTSILSFGSLPMRKNEPDCVADPEDMRALGYQVRYTWQEGIKRLIERVV